MVNRHMYFFLVYLHYLSTVMMVTKYYYICTSTLCSEIFHRKINQLG